MLGAEGDGLSRYALAAADSVVTIPMAGGVDSLNVAAASAVALWALGDRSARSRARPGAAAG
jgi:tRNA G18 (ribose-2'-O)-methylase SpoU